MHNWNAALSTLKKVIKEALIIHQDVDERLTKESKKSLCRVLVLLITRAARVVLQLGDIKTSEAYLSHAEQILSESGNDDGLEQMRRHLAMGRALIYYSKQDYPKASKLFLDVAN